MRAIGDNKKVAIIFFDKGGSEYSERNFLKILNDKIKFFAYGRNRVINVNGGFDFSNTDQDIKYAQAGLSQAKELLKNNKFDLLILDEVISCINLGLLKEDEVFQFLKNKPFDLELVLTGRNATKKIIDTADLVTEMKEVKHYYQQGIIARRGIDF